MGGDMGKLLQFLVRPFQFYRHALQMLIRAFQFIPCDQQAILRLLSLGQITDYFSETRPLSGFSKERDRYAVNENLLAVLLYKGSGVRRAAGAHGFGEFAVGGAVGVIRLRNENIHVVPDEFL